MNANVNANVVEWIKLCGTLIVNHINKQIHSNCGYEVVNDEIFVENLVTYQCETYCSKKCFRIKKSTDVLLQKKIYCTLPNNDTGESVYV